MLDLPVFLAVARLGSMTRAAAALNTVQSNVTSRVKRLETLLGVTLFVRGARRLRLTPEGETLMPFALRLEEISGDISRLFKKRVDQENGTLRLGAIETFAASKLTGLVSMFTDAHPSVDISVETASTTALQQKVLSCEIDAAFVSRRANDPILLEEPIFEDDLVLLAPPTFHSLEDLTANHRVLVQRVGCSFTGRLLDHMSKRALPAPPIHAVGTLEGLVSGVENGRGVAVLPESYVETVGAAAGLSAIPLPEEIRRVTIFLIVQRWNLPIRVLDDFVQLILKKRPNAS